VNGEVHPCQVHDGSQVRVPILAVVQEDAQGAFQEPFLVAFHGGVVFRDEVEEDICRWEEDDVGSEAFLDGYDSPLVDRCSSCHHGMVASGSEVS
jgi:hypothetical protein